jgi:putative spermidine/putrescine transport system permease protein
LATAVADRDSPAARGRTPPLRRSRFWAWFWIALGALFFLLPLIGTLHFSLRARRGMLSLAAYQGVFTDPRFYETFVFSLEMALLTVVVSLLAIVPAAYTVHLRLPRLRPLTELISTLPFVVPTIVLVFGLITIYSRPPLALTGSVAGTNVLLVAGYVVLVLPYTYRAIDTGLRAIDARELTEAAQSLGASWPTILWHIVLPNLRMAILAGALLTIASVTGELTLAQYLARPAFGPYLLLIGRDSAYEQAALALISFALTWLLIGVVFFLGVRAPRLASLRGIR